MDALEAPGVAVDVDALLALRHLVSEGRSRSARATSLPGGFVSRKRGRGLETADIRAFSHGDDPRHIDRNATARTGEPHVRNFQDERDRTALLLADFRPAMHWGTRRALRSVAAAEALTLIGWRVIAAGGRVGLIAFGGPSPVFVPARGRERGMIAVIGGMAAAHRASLHAASEGATANQPLSEAIEMADHIAPSGASVVLASSLDDPGEGFDRAVTALSHRADLTILAVRDEFETSRVAGAYPFETEDGKRGIARVSADASPAADSVDENLRKFGVAFHPVAASVPPTELQTILEYLDGR